MHTSLRTDVCFNVEKGTCRLIAFALYAAPVEAVPPNTLTICVCTHRCMCVYVLVHTLHHARTRLMFGSELSFAPECFWMHEWVYALLHVPTSPLCVCVWLWQVGDDLIECDDVYFFARSDPWYNGRMAGVLWLWAPCACCVGPELQWGRCWCCRYIIVTFKPAAVCLGWVFFLDAVLVSE